MNIRKILSFSIGPIAGAAVGLITIPMMSWYFNPEDIGRMRVFQVILSFWLIFSVLGLDQAYVREYHGSKDTNKLFKSCFLPGFVILMVSSLATIPFRKELNIWIFDTEDTTVFFLALMCIILNYFSRFQSLILRMQERGIAYSMSQVVPKFLQLVLLWLIVWFEPFPQFSVLLIILLSSMTAVVLIYSWNTRKELLEASRAIIETNEIRSLLKFGFPLVFSGLAYWALSATSTVMLRSHSTLGELGIYSVTSSIAGVAAIVQSILSVVLAPTVYKWVHQGVDMVKLDKITSQALAIICVIFAIVGTFAWTTDHLLPEHYTRVKFLLVCAITPPLLYTLSEITCLGIAITRRTTLTIWITFAALLSNILLCMCLIPAYGATGAVISNAVSYFVFFIGRTEVSASVWRSFPRKKMYCYLFIAIIFSILTSFEYIENIQHLTIVWFVIMVFVLMIFKRDLFSIYDYRHTS